MDLPTVNVIDAFSVVQKREKGDATDTAGETEAEKRETTHGDHTTNVLGCFACLPTYLTYLQSAVVERREAPDIICTLHQVKISLKYKARLDSKSPKSIRGKMSQNITDLLALPPSFGTHSP